MSYLYLLCAFILNASGNIFLKLGASRGFDFTELSPVYLFTHNWQFIVGCVLFILNVPFYFLALKHTPISVAYPVMVIMSFILINTYAYFFLKESISAYQLGGYLFVLIGLILIFYPTK